MLQQVRESLLGANGFAPATHRTGKKAQGGDPLNFQQSLSEERSSKMKKQCNYSAKKSKKK
jgi:hypothetical protein